MIEYSIFCNMIYVNMIINYQRIPLISGQAHVNKQFVMNMWTGGAFKVRFEKKNRNLKED
jgi:hypothetical protein